MSLRLASAAPISVTAGDTTNKMLGWRLSGCVSNTTLFRCFGKEGFGGWCMFTRSFDEMPLIKESGQHEDGNWYLPVIVAELEK